ncbi:ER membrane complex subunit 3 [Pichia californica]|uniref:ER membrane protein complex subunit 3 n=1 Tax=Pichia californica TaxID=460514 RepID=A0A9P6WK20_9ASCO|nr:ER membrane complex subunit 3 [[Candida] californica]
MESVNIILDHKIKTHVLLPITLVMLLVHILRQLLTSLLIPKQTLQKMEKVREQQHLQKCMIVSQTGWTSLCNSEWENKKNVIDDQYGKISNLNNILVKPIDENKSKSNQPEMTNPFTQAGLNETLWDGMKANLLNYLPQPILMFYMSYLFRGYIALKLPFTLTANFKPMFQSSIMTTDLDVSYVTGISWYFVNLLGVESLNKAIGPILGSPTLFSKPENNVLENISMILSSGGGSQAQQPQMQAAFGAPKPEDTFIKQSKGIRMTAFKSCLTNVEERFVNKYNL